MTIASYSDLQTAALNWANRVGDSVVTGVIADLITLAENRIFREMRIRQMESAFSGTIAANGTLAIPSDYLALRYIYVSGTNPVTTLKRRPPEYIYENYPTRTGNGIPQFIAEEAGVFIFGPYPDSQYTIAGSYFAKPGAIASGSNWFIANAPGIYLFSTLVEIALFLKDDAEAQRWEARYQDTKQQLMMQDKLDQHSGSEINTTVSWA